jgi:hypothetical protein
MWRLGVSKDGYGSETGRQNRGGSENGFHDNMLTTKPDVLYQSQAGELPLAKRGMPWRGSSPGWVGWSPGAR